MDTKVGFLPEDGERIVYIRPVPVETLPDEIREEVRARLGEAGLVYAVHTPDGERLALVRDRDMAFILARQNDFAPVNAH